MDRDPTKRSSIELKVELKVNYSYSDPVYSQDMVIGKIEVIRISFDNVEFFAKALKKIYYIWINQVTSVNNYIVGIAREIFIEFSRDLISSLMNMTITNNKHLLYLKNLILQLSINY